MSIYFFHHSISVHQPKETAHHLNIPYDHQPICPPDNKMYLLQYVLFTPSNISGHDLTPRSTSCRLVYITAYLTALVLLAAYSAALISSLTVYRSNLPFQDLEGILRDKTYKLGVVNMSEIYYTVSVSWSFVLTQLHN